MTRRQLLRNCSAAIVVGGALASGRSVGADLRACEPGLAPAPGCAPLPGIDYYQKLGVIPFINAAGTYTVLSASTMPDAVQAAVALAAQQPVQLSELLDAAGEYLAKRLRCEAALVTAGAAAGLTLGTAACVTVGNQPAIVSIPTDMAGLKNEVIVQIDRPIFATRAS